jgi:tRNA threonylcarbamoyladenosine biosynthesis protein TsaB
VKVLAIESSGMIGSAAVFNGRDLVAEASLDRGMEHGRMLVSLLDETTAKAGWDKREINLAVISLGPGSFTGLRVGVACAKTLAHSLGIPLAGVCSLDAMALNAPDDCDHVLTALDAKRGEVYAAAYERRDGKLERIQGPSLIKPTEAAAWFSAPYLVLGDGLKNHEGLLTSNGGEVGDEPLWRVRASAVGRLGIEAYEGGKQEDIWTLEPIYLRLPDAEEKRLAREQSAS